MVSTWWFPPAPCGVTEVVLTLPDDEKHNKNNAFSMILKRSPRPPLWCYGAVMVLLVVLVVPFYEKHKKTIGFLMFSRGPSRPPVL